MSPVEVLIPITAILVGGIIVVIPLAGITARLALKPLVDSYLRMKGASGGEQVELLSRRLALVEEQLHALEREQSRLVDEHEFRARLEAGK